MCKTYDAIFKIKKHATSDILHLWIEGAHVVGNLNCCCSEDKEKMTLEDIITLKDVTIECAEHHQKEEIKWLNIPSKEIKAFTFDCCIE